LKSAAELRETSTAKDNGLQLFSGGVLNAEDLGSSNGPSLFLEPWNSSILLLLLSSALANPARLAKGGETHNRQKIADGNK
jgi:hypothetical protein